MKSVLSALCLPLALLVLGSTPTRAQAQAVPPGAKGLPAPRVQARAALPDAAIPAATRAAVLDSLMAQIDRNYVFPDVGADVIQALRRHATRGDYDRITSARALVDTLNDHLYAVAHDLHLRVSYDPDQTMMMACGGGGPGGDVDIEQVRIMARQHNFGFEKAQRLSGNVGDLDLRVFEVPSLGAGETAAMAMGFLANCDALIIDLRRNGGGSAAMVELLMTYLLKPHQRVHLFDFKNRADQGTEVVQSWTLPYSPGPRFGGKDIYVLTSHITGSAAESFAYAVQAESLGTVVGETTAGAGNHGGGMVELPAGFSAFVATGVVTSPTTHAGWEGVGVKPDVAVPAESALREAHTRAVRNLLARATTREDRTRLQTALEQAEKTAPDPIELPPGMRIIMR
jgi:hypothetical protein